MFSISLEISNFFDLWASGLIRPGIPTQGPEIPETPFPAKEGFAVQKPPFSLEKGAFCQKIPFLLQGNIWKIGIFGLKTPFSSLCKGDGQWGFWTPKPAFQEMGIQAPVWGRGNPNIRRTALGSSRGPCFRCTPMGLVAPYCAIPRDYLSDTPLLRAMGFLVSQHGQLGATPPPPFLSVSPVESMRSGGAISPPPPRVSQRHWRDTL